MYRQSIGEIQFLQILLGIRNRLGRIFDRQHPLPGMLHLYDLANFAVKDILVVVIFGVDHTVMQPEFLAIEKDFVLNRLGD